MANLDHFIANSDYPFDKVVFFAEQRTNGNTLIKIPNPIGEPMLVEAIGTTDDWATSKDNIGLVSCGKDNIQMFINADLTAVQVWGYLPNSSNKTTEMRTAYESNSKLIFDTRLKYLKIFKEGVANLGAGQSVTIPHNLGFVPITKYWVELPAITGIGFDEAGLEDGRDVVDSNEVPLLHADAENIYIHNDSNNYGGIYWRIYTNATI